VSIRSRTDRLTSTSTPGVTLSASSADCGGSSVKLKTINDSINTSVTKNGLVIITLDNSGSGTVSSTSGTGNTGTGSELVTNPVTGSTNGGGSTFVTVGTTLGTLGSSRGGDI